MSKNSSCPNILMKVDTKYYLFNSKLPRTKGVNPIEFNTLEDYTDFLKWQKTVGIKCPVLHVEKIYDAQGNRVFKLRPSAFSYGNNASGQTYIYMAFAENPFKHSLAR